LDIMAPQWEALVLEDYEYVMPLPVKKKYGITFLVQPPLTQQLGIFSANKIDKNVAKNFIQKIPYKSFHLNFNEQNPFDKGIKRPNFALNLNKDYQTIFSAYSTNTKRNIKKFYNYNIEIKADIPATDFLNFYHATEKNYTVPPTAKVNQLIRESFEKNKITIYGAYSTDSRLISALCLLHSAERLIYLLPLSNSKGKETLAMFGIVNEIIKKYATCNLILDFEGSKIGSIAHFYQGFGTELHYYYEIKRWSVNDLLHFFHIFAPRKKIDVFFSHILKISNYEQRKS